MTIKLYTIYIVQRCKYPNCYVIPLSRVSGGDCEGEVGARRLEEVLLGPHVGGEQGRPVVHVFVDLAIIIVIIIIIIIITIHLAS